VIKALQGMFCESYPKTPKANIYVMNHLLAAIALHNVHIHGKILLAPEMAKERFKMRSVDKRSEFVHRESILEFYYRYIMYTQL
jgi:hypothetical protein